MPEFYYPRVIDWPMIFADLESHNCGPYRISILIGRPLSTVMRWTESTEPKHSDGVALLELHRRYCGDTLTNQRESEALLSS